MLTVNQDYKYVQYPESRTKKSKHIYGSQMGRQMGCYIHGGRNMETSQTAVRITLAIIAYAIFHQKKIPKSKKYNTHTQHIYT